MEAIIERILGYTTRNKPGNVRHICHKQCPDLIANSGKLFIVEFARVGAKTSKDNFWLMFKRKRAKLIVVDLTGADVFHFISYEVI
ncbi:hypothetical protein D3C85_1342620 [compost metagenome]